MELWHYTTLKSALSILKAGKIVFHGSRYDCMNDPTDFMFSSQRLLPLASKIMSCEEKDLPKNYPYIVSFCRSKDDFSMWRMYKAEVALVFDSNMFPYNEWDNQLSGNSDKGVLYREVEYVSEDTNEIVEKAFLMNKTGNHSVDGGYNLASEFYMNVIPFIKHKAYENESEYRLVKYDSECIHFEYNPDKKDNCDITEYEHPRNVHVDDRIHGDIRLYKEFELPKESLIGFVIHTFDKNKFISLKSHIELALRMDGYKISEGFIQQTKSYPIIY